MNKTISKRTIVITPNLPVYRVRVKRDGAHSIALMIGLISKELWSSLNRVLNECESGSSYLASTSGGWNGRREVCGGRYCKSREEEER